MDKKHESKYENSEDEVHVNDTLEVISDLELDELMQIYFEDTSEEETKVEKRTVNNPQNEIDTFKDESYPACNIYHLLNIMFDNTKMVFQEQIIHPTDSIFSRSTFSLSSQSNITNNTKQLWLIRHGERMDEIQTAESDKWRDNVKYNREFDPPLTINGYKQAEFRGKLLMDELNNINNINSYPKCIYASPTMRTLATAMQVSKCTHLPIIVIPGLSECAAAIIGGVLFKKEHELFIEQYCAMTKLRFLTKTEIIKQFGDKVNISFEYKHIDKYKDCIKRLVKECETNIILCVTHRVGMIHLDKRLSYSKIPYCAFAKFAVMDHNENSNDFVYFESDY